jgi:hypothetical protein
MCSIGRIEQSITPSNDAREFGLSVRADILKSANGWSSNQGHNQERRIGWYSIHYSLYAYRARDVAECR